MRRAPIIAVVASLLCGCAGTRDWICLLPDADGHVGRISIEHDDGRASLLEGDYNSARVDDSGRVRFVAMSRAEVRTRYGKVLEVLPPRPLSFTLYFVGDTDRLTVESDAEARKLSALVESRPMAEVTLIDHTDRMPSQTSSDSLALARAGAVRKKLIEIGMDASRISVHASAAPETPVPAPHGVSEKRHRHVEAVVR